MSSLRKNVGSQVLTFGLVNASSGAALTGASFTAKAWVTGDGTQAGFAGTFTDLGNGQYKYVPTQAETNVTSFGLFVAPASAVPVNMHMFTDNWDTTQAFIPANVTTWNGTAVSVPATAGIPDVNVKNINNAAAATPGASGGILISGSNAGTTTFGALTVTGALTATGGLVANITGNLSGTVANITGTPNVNLVTWLGGAPNALISGRVDSNTQAMATGVIASGVVTNAAWQDAANQHLDLANAIETGITPRLAHRYSVAAAAGNTSGMATTTAVLQGAGVGTTRITATVDANGNRSGVILS